MDADRVKVYMNEEEPIIMPREVLAAMLGALNFVRLEEMTFWKHQIH